MPKSRTPSLRNGTRRQRWTPEKASAVLAKHAASGLSIQQFATREGLDPERLYRWRRNLGGAQPVPPTFVEVRASARPRIELVLRSGHVLFVSEVIDSTVLRRLVDALDRDGEC
jgi:transposase-like protein